MEAKHTAGQVELSASRGSRGEGYLFVGNLLIATVLERGGSAGGNATRMAACWNACEGINPEAVPDLLAKHNANVTAVQDCFAGIPPEADQGHVADLPQWAQDWIRNMHTQLNRVLNRGEAAIAKAQTEKG